jgi:mycofactocin precursor
MTEQAQMEATQAQDTRAGGDQIGRLAGEVQATGEAPATGEALAADEALIAEELLVEEVSIDGMCGVY